MSAPGPILPHMIPHSASLHAGFLLWLAHRTRKIVNGELIPARCGAFIFVPSCPPEGRSHETSCERDRMRLPAREVRNLAPGRPGGFEPGADKCRDGAPEGERADRKVRARLRTACGWPIARLA